MDKLKRYWAEREKLHDGQASQRKLSEDYEKVGVKGEAEFCRVFRVRQDMVLRLRGNKGKEYRLTFALCPLCNAPNCIHGRPAYRARVRTQAWSKTEWVIEYEKLDADLFVFAFYDRKKDEASLIGWLTVKEIMRFPHSVWPLTIDNYRFKRRALRGIASLLQLLGLPLPPDPHGQLDLF